MLGRHAPTRVLDVDAKRVVLGRRSTSHHAFLVVTGATSTTWDLPKHERCTTWQVSDARGPVPQAAEPAWTVPAASVGIAVCDQGSDVRIANAFASSPQLVDVTLTVPPGKVLVGTGPQLGRWNPAKGLSTTTTLQVPAGTILEYKLVESVDGSWQWPEGRNTVLLAR